MSTELDPLGATVTPHNSLNLLERELAMNTTKVVLLDRQKRLDEYWTVLKQLGDKWSEDLSDLKSMDEISKEDFRAEIETLDLFWNLVEVVDELSRESVGINEDDV